MQQWTAAELDEFHRFFEGAMRLPTLYERIHRINPQRSFDSVSRKIRRMKAEGDFVRDRDIARSKLRIGYLDIEASNLNADFGIILTWYIKPEGSDECDFAIITRREIMGYTFDKRVVTELLKALQKYDIIYTHYGADRRFDMPFIRTRAFAHGIEHLLPNRDERFLRDTWPIARMKLKLHSNRLDSIAEALQIEDVKKTPLRPKVWQKAMYGDAEALKYIAEHNYNDVLLLERVHQKLRKVENPQYVSM